MMEIIGNYGVLTQSITGYISLRERIGKYDNILSAANSANYTNILRLYGFLRDFFPYITIRKL